MKSKSRFRRTPLPSTLKFNAPRDVKLLPSMETLYVEHKRKKKDDSYARTWLTLLGVAEDVINGQGEKMLPPDDLTNRWFYTGVLCKMEDIETFGVVTIRNRRQVNPHVLDDYFDSQDRFLIFKKLREEIVTEPDVKQREFGNQFARLFKLRDMMEGTISVEPISKKIVDANLYPAKHYSPSASVVGRIDERTDYAFRGHDVRDCVDKLVRLLKTRRPHHFRAAFQHIADGGDGNVSQERRDLDPKRVFFKSLDDMPKHAT